MPRRKDVPAAKRGRARWKIKKLFNDSDIEGCNYADVSYKAIVSCETDDYVTYEFVYDGEVGCRAVSVKKGLTFCKQGGLPIDNSIFKENIRRELGLKIKDALVKQYLKPKAPGQYTGSMDDFNPYIGDEEDMNTVTFPLPESAPLVLTEKGIRFTYNEYEIAPPTMGCPTCTLSYKDIEPYLTDSARLMLAPIFWGK